jgi:hypothetical protein
VGFQFSRELLLVDTYSLDKSCRPGMLLMTRPLITFYASRFDICIHCHNTPFTSEGGKKERTPLCVQFSRFISIKFSSALE